ncbi:MAG TPA: hypothetical protein VNG71_14165 [Pyrinomonadaceae bacterium]|nr:hypothetical protein [Pyrinomonadaceae bacterium]
MNSEERIARLERLTKLFARAGRRERRRIGTVEEKIDIIIDFQIANEERFARNEEQFARNEERFAQLAEAQTQTQKRLDALMQAIERDRNGHSS